MKNQTRFHKIVSLLLVLCMLFSFCSVLSACGKKDKGDDGDGSSNTDGTNGTGSGDSGSGDTTPPCAHTNTSLQGKKDATCILDGYTGDVVCNDCTAIVTAGSVIQKTGVHTYNNGEVTKTATCMDQGKITYTCTGCGTHKEEPTPTVAHDDVYHDNGAGQHIHTCANNCTLKENGEHTPTDAGVKYAATCTEDAYTEYTCSLCEGIYKVYSTTELALKHNFSAWDVTEATCMADGYRTQHCQNPGCNEVNTIPIPRQTVSCNIVFVGYEDGHGPDCSHGATALYECKDCHTPGESKILPATGLHNYVQLEDTGDGWIRKQCSVDGCGDLISSYDASKDLSATVSTADINKDVALEMNMKEAAIQFPSEVVSDITSGTNLEVSAGTLDTDKKNAAVNNVQDADKKALLANAPVYDFTVKVDNQPYTENFTTGVAITIPYDHGNNDAEGLVIYYLANDGTIEEIKDVVYDADKKQVSFFVNHFSYYAVAYEETQEMRCKRGDHNYQPTGNVVTATCYQFGYTEMKCSGCARITIDSIVAREEHSYGNIIEAQPTCDNGDWSYRVCSNDGCGSRINVQFFGSLGHTMDRVATCDTASTCTTCHKILAHPLGHNWTAWTVVREATELATGLRTRACLNCGEIQEDVLATTGTVEAIEFETYSEFVSVILEEFLNVSNGKLSFDVEAQGEHYVVDLKVMKKDNGYRMSFVVNDVKYDDKTEFYYDNGVFVLLRSDGYATASELDNLIPVTVALYKDILEEVYEQLDSYATMCLEMMRDMIAQYKDVYGEQINEILAAAKLPYTVDSFSDLVDSVETVYAYVSLKLGFTTAQEMKTDVVLPTKADILAVLELLTEKTEDMISTTYTLTAEPILDAFDGLVTFLKDNEQKTLAEFIYLAIKDDVLAYDSTLVDFNAVIDYIATNFPGTFTVSDAVSKYTDFAEEAEFMSFEQLCAAINLVAGMAMGTEFDAQAMVNEYGSMTLDQLVQALTKSETATVADYYAMIKEMAASTKVGDLAIKGMKLSDAAAMLENFKNSTNLGLNFSLATDKAGNLISLTFDQSLSMNAEDPADEALVIDRISISINRDNGVKIDVPAVLKDAMRDVTTSYDADGNLVIEGLNPDVQYSFEIDGNGKADFDEILEKDEALSALYGFDIYVLKEAYWNDVDQISTYILKDGKYYEESSKGHCNVIRPLGSLVTFNDFKASIADRVASIDTKNAKIRGYLAGTDAPVYSFSLTDNSSDIGIAYKNNGEWMIATTYSYAPNYADGEGRYYAVDPMTVSEFVATIELGISNNVDNFLFNKLDTFIVSYNGVNYPAANVSISYGSGKAVNVIGFYRNNQLFIVNSYTHIKGVEIYELEAERTVLPEHDYKTTWNHTIAIYNNGSLELVDVTQIYFHKRVPTYYVKVADGVYTEHNRLNGHGGSNFLNSLDTSNMEAIELTDENTLYVLGRTHDNDYGYKYGYETVYGYAKVESGVYMQAAALIDPEGNMVDVLYRYGAEEADIYIDRMFSVEEYITVNNGVYTISNELFEQLDRFCQSEMTVYYISINGEETVNGITFRYMYMVGSKVQMPEIDISDIAGSFTGDSRFWADLFGGGNGDSEAISKYEIIKNDDGSITLVLPLGTEISDISFNTNAQFPAENLWVKDEAKSAQTGLNIYSCERSYTVTNSEGSYVYRNEKYYDYDTVTNYALKYSSIEDIKATWIINNTTYRFQMVGSGELPADMRVYETEVKLQYREWYDSYGATITLYTFFIDGVMNVATEARVEGESLLVFEGYKPLDEYMDSLVFELNNNDGLLDKKDGLITLLRVNGVNTAIYRAALGIYEPVADGNKILLASPYINYVIVNGEKKFITDFYEKDVSIKIGNEVSVNATGKVRNEWLASYSNGTVTMVDFRWEETLSDTAYFVELAGRMYRYNSGAYHYWWANTTYQSAKLTKDEFENAALDKEWCYKVFNSESGEETYYSKFIPSDLGFTPVDEITDPSFIFDKDYSETLLGYTADGMALYEISYYVQPDDEGAEWTEEEQDDGTVFLHKNGIGYLKVTEKNGIYYVRARKVEMEDGSSNIYCFLRTGCLIGGEIGDFVGTALDGYVTVSLNTITITEEFLEVAKNNDRNEFYVMFSEYDIHTDFIGYSLRLDYYMLESLFMLGTTGGSGNMGGGMGNIGGDGKPGENGKPGGDFGWDTNEKEDNDDSGLTNEKQEITENENNGDKQPVLDLKAQEKN